MFDVIHVDLQGDTFNALSQVTQLEDVSHNKGREGGVFVQVEETGAIPLVRTTTRYTQPAQPFHSIHTEIKNKIKTACGVPGVEFNNALIELYDWQYRSMGYHSDQAQDLAYGSYIAVFSCYEHPEDTQTENLRKLIVQNKATEETREIVMHHGSVILFSLDTNAMHRHKIVLPSPRANNRWFGMTFRMSKSFVCFDNGVPLLHGKELRLASPEERKMYFKLRSAENRACGTFEWPELDFSISESDLMPVTRAAPAQFSAPLPAQPLACSETAENELLLAKHIFLCVPGMLHGLGCEWMHELEFLRANFCGRVCESVEELALPVDGTLYICGDIGLVLHRIQEHLSVSLREQQLGIIRELSWNELAAEGFTGEWEDMLVRLGQVPINVCNVGVMFRGLFDDTKDHFDAIVNEHAFLPLTESNKPNIALRTGVYISRVTKEERTTNDTADAPVPAADCNGPTTTNTSAAATAEGEAFRYHLLRCSTNFGAHGPTDNVQETDEKLLTTLNEQGRRFFDKPVALNHVLAQVYHNSRDTKDRKAKIKAHSDKTKDMPREAIMAFCTFYEGFTRGAFHVPRMAQVKRSDKDPFDYCYKRGDTVLTKLRFRLKPDVMDSTLARSFDVTLYPNSVFMMSLRTNRLYTHETVPAALPVDVIPIRMGYVVRCSKTPAVYQNGKTYITRSDEEWVQLVPPTQAGIKQLKDLYFQENATSNIITYPLFNFSLNEGDMVQPKL